MTDAGLAARVAAVGLLAAGAVLRSETLLAAGTGVLGAARFVTDLLRRGPGGVHVVSVYALAAGTWFGFANLAAYLLRGTEYGPLFFQWQADDHVFTGQCIASLGVIVPLAADAWLRRLLPGLGERAATAEPPAPPVAGPTRWDAAAAVLTVLGWIAHARPGFLPSFLGAGKPGEILALGPDAAIFLLATCRVRGLLAPTLLRTIALGLLVVAEVAAAALYSNMRLDLVWPLAALLLPALLARRPGRLHVVGAVGAGLIFVLAFRPMADSRTEYTSGLDRVRTIGTGVADSGDGARVPLEVMARLTTFNQLSRVAELVDDRGPAEGETLEWIRWALIPRALWPGKPEVSPGRWFAEALGRGRERADGRWSNAINLTVPGELYLNFRWTGAVAGLALMVLLYRVAWHECRRTFDPVGETISFFVIGQAIVIGSHAGAIVNLALWWVVLLGLRWARPPAPAGAPVAAPGGALAPARGAAR